MTLVDSRAGETPAIKAIPKRLRPTNPVFDIPRQIIGVFRTFALGWRCEVTAGRAPSPSTDF
jgi:hypothetical protein